METLKIIEDIENLNLIQTLSNNEIDEVINTFDYAPIKHYLSSLKIGTKPETATAELVKWITLDVLEKKGFSELKIEGGFIDFAIQELKVNPIMIELKPAFDRTTDKNNNTSGIIAKELDFTKHQNQIQKYLRHNDFIILTNTREAYLFNRDAIIDFKPFYTLKFTEILRQYLDSESLWDIIRLLEDQLVKPELEAQFFSDLNKWYNEFDVVKFKDTYKSKKELIVLLINKIIFIKTLEDYGLIPYKFIDDEYSGKVVKWSYKGNFKLFDNFFKELEDWFWEYYDTELFRTKIWEYIDKDEKNLDTFRIVFERVLGVGSWEHSYGKGMIHYNYRKIDEDVFGKAYETFIAKQRKDSGIFYTHKLLTQYMSERIVKELFDPVVNEILEFIEKSDFENAFIKMCEMYNITIADTTSGSGSFLIKVFREIYKYYQKISDKLKWVYQIQDMFGVPDNVKRAEAFLKKTALHRTAKRKLISNIILRHIHAIDIDDRALETAKTNLWKEAVKLEKKLFRYLSLGSANNHILPNLRLNFHCADSLYDLPVEKQIEELSKFKNDIIELHKIRSKYIENTTNPEILEDTWSKKYLLRKHLSQFLIEKLSEPLFICVEFFYLFFDESGEPLPEDKRGFSGIISNPPWEAIKPVKKEFAQVAKLEMNILDFDKWFSSKLKEDEEFRTKWNKYTGFYEKYSNYLTKTYIHQNQGDLNYYKLFIERNLQIIKSGGYLNILVPSGIQTDKGCSDLRKLIIDEYKLIEIYSFENRGYKEDDEEKINIKIFPDIDSRFKFTITFCQKKKETNDYQFSSKFYLHNPKELYNSHLIYFDKAMMKRFSPDNLSIMEFKTEKDYEICCKIRNGRKLLEESDFVLRTEFHMTNDSNLFNDKPIDNKHLKLYEGKMIHQFNSNYSNPKYWINEKEAKKILLGKEKFRIKKIVDLNDKDIESIFLKNKFKLDYQSYRLVYRAIGSSTNERSLICSIVPGNIFIGHSMNYIVNFFYEKTNDNNFIQKQLQANEMIYILALLNSLTLNYFIRNKISANLTMNFIYELPIPEIKPEFKDNITNLAFNLLYSKSEKNLFDALAKELKIKPENNINEIETRAELEVIIAKELYGLNYDDWEYITSTFIYGDESETKKELDEIIIKSKKIFGRENIIKL